MEVGLRQKSCGPRILVLKKGDQVKFVTDPGFFSDLESDLMSDFTEKKVDKIMDAVNSGAPFLVTSVETQGDGTVMYEVALGRTKLPYVFEEAKLFHEVIK